MALPRATDLEQLGTNSSGGCIAQGQHVEVIACGSATTLTADDSGATILLDTAAGSTVTLPTPVAGMVFDLTVSVSVTSNSHIITTADTSTEFLSGGLQMMIDTTAVSEGQFLDGATHITLTHNGSTTGGLIGTQYRFVAISSTVWNVTGLCAGSGTLATPATT